MSSSMLQLQKTFLSGIYASYIVKVLANYFVVMNGKPQTLYKIMKQVSPNNQDLKQFDFQ